MTPNLLQLVQDHFGGETTRQASTALGESEGGVGAALRSIVPLVLGGVLARSQQPGGATDLFGMAQQAHSSGILGNLGSLLGGMGGANASTPAADGGLLNRGAEMLRSVLGNQYAPAVEGVSQQAGVQASTVSSLMGMATPVVLGLLGRHASDNNLDANGFGSYLSSQKDAITGAMSNLPGGLGTLLSGGLGLGAAATGMSSMASMAAGLGNAASAANSTMSDAAQTVSNTAAAAASRTGDAVRNTAREVEAATTTSSRWPLLLALVLGLAALIYFMRSCNKAPETSATTTTAATDTTRMAAALPPAAAPAAPAGRYDASSGNYVYDTGANTSIKLPDGTTLNVGDNSFESRLFAFLNDNTQTVGTDKTQGWMSLDRVYFTTGKAALTAESQAQLKNLAAILKAFPNAAVKLGGYTDNKGKADQNLLLSADRANAARKSVVAQGIAPTRVTAEGYGVEHPIASNDTPEGRAQNRRVDVRVTKK